MNQQFLTELNAVVAENRIFTDEPMKKHTTFRVGGPADVLVMPERAELAAVIRLAYFNVTEETRQQQTTEKRKYYQGLPVTTSAFILPFAFALRYVIFGLDYLYGTLMLITGILFVVDFKVPKLKGKGLIALGVLVVVELVQILCFS